MAGKDDKDSFGGGGGCCGVFEMEMQVDGIEDNQQEIINELNAEINMLQKELDEKNQKIAALHKKLNILLGMYDVFTGVKKISNEAIRKTCADIREWVEKNKQE
jgi:predicted RNase H-like nuclease (RuvC/YqgF family)